VEEELRKIRAAAATRDAAGDAAAKCSIKDAAAAVKDAAGGHLEEELGDLLFSAINLCRLFGTDPSVALQRANGKFDKRFRHVERRMKEAGLPMDREHLEAMDAFWEEAKDREPH
jgi:uncharacterized protein YabN with tetrapyrrole methylase and pyrophosphatase domain